MIFRKFNKSDTSSCKKLWDLSFDDNGFSGVFFSDIIKFADAYVCEYKSNIVGFISLFYFEAVSDEKEVDCRYIYGVCVHPDFRKRGIMSKMLNEVMSLYDCQFILVPHVYGVYEKFGFAYVDSLIDDTLDNPLGDCSECYDIGHLDKIYNSYRKKFSFSLTRTKNWWNILVKILKADGYQIIANDGAYAVFKNGTVLEFAYESDEYKKLLPIGNATLKTPDVMSFGNLEIKSNCIALMLEWE